MNSKQDCLSIYSLQTISYDSLGTKRTDPCLKEWCIRVLDPWHIWLINASFQFYQVLKWCY